VTPEARRAGEAIAASAGELTRVWRSARLQARPGAFPGLLDGVMEGFFTRAGEALAADRDPALLWPSTTGIVRLDPVALDRSREEIEAEWDLAVAVLASACEALGAGEAAAEWLERAIVLARAGSRTLDARGGPRTIVVVWALSGLGARRLASGS
jgi:hypothetical protein